MIIYLKVGRVGSQFRLQLYARDSACFRFWIDFERTFLHKSFTVKQFILLKIKYNLNEIKNNIFIMYYIL